jgi:hypothetical protein
MVSRQGQPTAEGALDESLLRIYLRDHLAAAVGGAALARRTLESNRGTLFESDLERLAANVEEDRQTLARIMGRMAITPSFPKQAAVWSLEKLSRLKLNGRMVKYSPLSRLVELEVLESGIDGKRAMWTALAQVAGGHMHLDIVELRRLEKRAVDQRKLVEAMRLQAARLALTPGLGEPG